MSEIAPFILIGHYLRGQPFVVLDKSWQFAKFQMIVKQQAQISQKWQPLRRSQVQIPLLIFIRSFNWTILVEWGYGGNSH